jgi:hypothetical protein
MNENTICKNTDCVINEDDEHNEKCSICPGYYADDGLNDILFIEEAPNNRNASCDLCKKTNDIVQMKGTGQYICQNACDDEDEDDDEETEEDKYLKTLNEKELQAYEIAKSHLGNTFHLKKSNGFIDWKKTLYT